MCIQFQRVFWLYSWSHHRNERKPVTYWYSSFQYNGNDRNKWELSEILLLPGGAPFLFWSTLCLCCLEVPFTSQSTLVEWSTLNTTQCTLREPTAWYPIGTLISKCVLHMGPRPLTTCYYVDIFVPKFDINVFTYLTSVDIKCLKGVPHMVDFYIYYSTLSIPVVNTSCCSTKLVKNVF